jgi:hypothetical protein
MVPLRAQGTALQAALGVGEIVSALLAYLEWGTRLAFENSHVGASPTERVAVPRRGWGEAPPYKAQGGHAKTGRFTSGRTER